MSDERNYGSAALGAARTNRSYPNLRHRIASALGVLAAIVLGCLALAKLAMLVLHFNQFSRRNEFLSMLPNWLLLLGSVFLELTVIIKILSNLRVPRNIGFWLIWFCTVVGIYRVGIWLFSPGSSCHCLGILAIALGSGERTETTWAVGILIALADIGLIILYLGRGANRVLTGVPRVALCVGTIILSFSDLGMPRSYSAVQISGHISSEYFSATNALINHGQSEFRVVRDGSHWQLYTEQPNSESYTIISDGSSTFALISATNTTLRMAARGATNLNSRAQIGIIDTWSAPIFTPAETLPWWFLIFSEDDASRYPEPPTPWTVPKSDTQAYFVQTS